MEKISFKNATLVDLLRWRAINEPDHHAYTFLIDNNREAERLTYAELDQQARAIAAHLQSLDTKGDRALLLYPAGLEIIKAFFGCLYAGIVAIPAPFPEASRLKRTLPRLQAIAKDAQVSLVLGNANIISQLEEYRQEVAELQGIKYIDINSIDPQLAESWEEYPTQVDDLAYLQYTSGSTSTPKGVMLTHGNVVSHCHYIQQVCEYDENSVSVTWLPYFHDYGLVEGILEPLYNGTPGYIMSPFAFMKRPLNWLKAISDYQGTHTQAPNFAYDQCVRRIKPEDRASLNLKSWRSAGNGAEPINPKVLEKFYQTYAPNGLTWNASCPAYGLAEATLMVSCCSPSLKPTISYFEPEALTSNKIVEASDKTQARAITSCGPLLADTKVLIVNPDTLKQCNADEVGEIWVASSGVAKGYWQRPDATQETFLAYVADTQEGPFLRTGDLGFIKDGQLYITSRIKDLIIIAGTNHYPQDIEWNVEKSHPYLRPNSSAAFSIQVDGEEKLVVAQELERGYKPEDIEEIFNVIRKVITTEHEVAVYAVLLLSRGSLPKTASGKIQRSICWKLFQEGSLEVIASWIADGSAPKAAQSPTKPPAGKVSSIQPKTPLVTAPDDVSKKRADDLIAWLRDYSEERIDSRLIDERRCLPPYIVLDFGNQGLMGLQVPEKYGGLALKNRDLLRVFEQLAAIDLSIASLLFIHNTNGVRPLVGYATPTIQEELLPILAQGRELAAFALTEPTAGSNLPNIGTIAIPDAKGGWRLRGAKRWNASGWAGIIHVFAKTLDENGKVGHPSAFVVRQRTPGLQVGPESLTMGVRGIMQNIIYFDDVLVSPTQLLGEVNKGMDVAEEAMLLAHLCMASLSVGGGMKRCAQLMLRYANRRQVSTGRLLDNPTILAVLSELTIKITLIQNLLNQLVTVLDEEDYPPKEIGMMLKILSTDYLWQASDDLVETLGGRGYMENNIAPQIMRDCRMLRIGEGANEIMTITVGRRVFHSEELHQFLINRLGNAAMSERLKEAAQQIQARCLSANGRFSNRSSALSWAYNLIGKVSILGVVLAAAQSSARRFPSESLNLAVEWASYQFESTLSQALKGFAIESLMLNTQQTQDLIDHYAESIGDLEQRPPGIEDKLDPLLRRDISNSGFPDFSHLPGNVNLEKLVSETPAEATPKLEDLSLEQKRALIQKLLVKNGSETKLPEMSSEEKRNLLEKLLQNKQ
ncbi:AMP-binding protein [Gloeothece verrucosa]|uniref:AMP-dependent synthetase and ligase n=1 Tax=Gloeothece verrucosa (strain PCC 7822) TaxID=497965 RepID=E0ULB3_GLOV7|nr:AMP-binding protein [Gloeothece verrucosa]ADN17743.1 AMP-dependent synthetase and ligase [Gloeothece verrucosa PCC 7822]